MGRVTVAGGKPVMGAAGGVRLGEVAEGSLVKIIESGAPVEFYVAKHDYESALNGTGKTLLVRKDCYNQQTWNQSGVTAYAGSTIDVWLDGDYKAMLDEKVESAIDEIEIYSAISGTDFTVRTIKRSVFLMSVVEGGGTGGYVDVSEGTALPTADKLKIAYYNGTAVNQWTRTPYSETSSNYLRDNGSANASIASYQQYCRPAFTLPASAVFDAVTLAFKGVG